MAKPRLAGPRMVARRARIFEGAAREAIIAKTREILGGWTLSAFQHEASCRCGLRTALVLAGHRWPLADLEAEMIVSAALAANGARRPTWWQGQPESAHVYERCLWCFAPIEDGGRLFCSDVCARSAKMHRAYREHEETRFIESAAYHLVARADAQERICETCGNPFRSNRRLEGRTSEPPQRYCSTACASLARRRSELDKICPSCGKHFRAQRAEIKTCSQTCHVALAKATSPAKTCLECGAQFHGVPNAKFCSVRCRSRAANRASYAKRKAGLTPA